MDIRALSCDVSSEEAKAIQTRLSRDVLRCDQFANEVHHVAGVDVAYDKCGRRAFAGIVILDADSFEVVETRTATDRCRFPYVPGLFAFRELPHLLKCFEQVKFAPDLVICDGQGIAHPRRFGLASHLGVLLDIPTIGCGKTRHVGEYQEPRMRRGDFSPLVDGDETIGSVLRTQDGIKPLFVSIGHRVSLPSARAWILRLASKYRQPEPIRRVNEAVNKLRASS